MPNLLILDASSSLCSVALLTDQGDYWKTETQPRRHAQRLLEMVDELISESVIQRQDLDGVAFGRGPGSFTGIRIAVSVAQGLSLGLDIPVCGISSLQAMAQAAAEESAGSNSGQVNCMTLMDAHMGEVFWGQFCVEEGLSVALSDERVGSPEECLSVIREWSGQLAGTGLGLPAFDGCLQTLNHIQPEARYMASLARKAWAQGSFADPGEHPPVYLRNSVAWKKLNEQPSLLNPNKG